jgi:carbon-monoxide dehydrogenase large subunit
VSAAATPRSVGARVRRKEDPRLLTGRGRYVDDVRLARTLHAAFVRSTYAHARIGGIDVEQARGVPGVIGVYTAADLGPRVLPPRAINYAPGSIATDFAVLAPDGRVRNVGQPVAVVVGESRYQAEDGAELVFVDYEPLPVVTSVDQALAPGVVPIHEELPDNLFMRYDVASGETEQAFAEADLVLELETRNQRYGAVPLEGRAALADYDPALDELTLWLSSQVPHLHRTGISRFLDIPENRVRVISPDVGGGFGPKAVLYPEELVVSAISRLLGQPVKWVSDRSEDLQSSCHGREQIHRLRAAVRADGRILGIAAQIFADAGAYAHWPWGAGTDAAQAEEGMTGMYDIPNYTRTTHAVVTNKVPGGPYRGVGKVMACFSMERIVEHAAARLGIDPLEIRRRNLVRSFPHMTAGRYRLESGDYERALDLAAGAIAWDETRAENDRLRAEGRYRGLGIACGIELTAHGGEFLAGKHLEIVSGYDSASVRMDPDGKVRVAVGLHSHGQGHETTIAQIAADELGLEPDDVRVVFGDTAVVPYGLGTWGSRSTVYCGGATILAAGDIRDKLLRIGAEMLEANPSDLELDAGRVRVAGSPDRFVTIAEVARRTHHEPHLLPEGEEPGLEAVRRYEAPSPGSFTSAVHAAHVEVDPDVGEVKILRYVVVEDCGRVINPLVVEGQVHGGVAQGIGGALLEELAYDDEGQLLSTTLMDYLLPGFTEVPRIDVLHLESPSPYTLGGFKGMGEGGAIMSPVAVVNAVNDALRPFGVVADHTPITPDWIVHEVRRAREAVAA